MYLCLWNVINTNQPSQHKLTSSESLFHPISSSRASTHKSTRSQHPCWTYTRWCQCLTKSTTECVLIINISVLCQLLWQSLPEAWPLALDPSSFSNRVQVCDRNPRFLKSGLRNSLHLEEKIWLFSFEVLSGLRNREIWISRREFEVVFRENLEVVKIFSDLRPRIAN